MKWLLIIWIGLGNGGPTAIEKYNTKQECDTAASVLFSSAKLSNKYWCVKVSNP